MEIKFKELKEALVHLEALTKKLRAMKGNRKSRRAERRLSKIPKDRKCPVCSNICLNSAQWQTQDGKLMCISCAREIRKARRER